jgi:hypothetical protein
MADLNDCGIYPYELLQGAYGSSELIVVENKAFRKEKKIDENHHYVRCRFSNKSGCKVRGIIDTDQETFRYTRYVAINFCSIHQNMSFSFCIESFYYFITKDIEWNFELFSEVYVLPTWISSLD